MIHRVACFDSISSSLILHASKLIWGMNMWYDFDDEKWLWSHVSFFFSFHFRSWAWRRVNVSFENAMKLLRRVALLKPSSFVADSIAVYTPFWLFEELDRFGFQAQTFFHLHSLELVAPPLINQLSTGPWASGPSTFCW